MNIRIRVHARSSKNEIIEVGGLLHAYVTAPPLEGKANMAVRDLIAEKYDVPKSSVKLVRGAQSTIKDFEL